MGYKISYETEELSSGGRVTVDCKEDPPVYTRIPRLEQVATIRADTMEDLGLAIDEVEKKWPGSDVRDDAACWNCHGIWSPSRIKGKWHLKWGRSILAEDRKHTSTPKTKQSLWSRT